MPMKMVKILHKNCLISQKIVIQQVIKTGVQIITENAFGASYVQLVLVISDENMLHQNVKDVRKINHLLL